VKFSKRIGRFQFNQGCREDQITELIILRTEGLESIRSVSLNEMMLQSWVSKGKGEEGMVNKNDEFIQSLPWSPFWVDRKKTQNPKRNEREDRHRCKWPGFRAETI